MLVRVLRFGLLLAIATSAVAADVVWRIDNVEKIASQPVAAVGTPRVVEGLEGAAVQFDGGRDGLFVPLLPVAKAGTWTIEVLFRPDDGGLAEQRFLHLQDNEGRRALLELRTEGKGTWWLDTFLRGTLNGGDEGLVLVDPKLTHATGRWYWVAMRYDGRRLAAFVDGRKELEGETPYSTFTHGKVSIGVRQTRVSWFKGAIQEVRFHDEAIADGKLQRVPLK